MAVKDDCPSVDGSQSRLAVIGMTVPNDDHQLVYLFQPQAASAGEVFQVPLPNRCKKTLSISSQQSQLVSFNGGETVANKKFFDDWFLSRQWKAGGDWQGDTYHWFRVFRPENANSEIASVKVNLTEDSTGQLRGLVVVEPRPQSN